MTATPVDYFSNFLRFSTILKIELQNFQIKLKLYISDLVVKTVQITI